MSGSTITLSIETTWQRRFRVIRLTLGLLAIASLACVAVTCVADDSSASSHLSSDVASFSTSAPLMRMPCSKWAGVTDDGVRLTAAEHVEVAYLHRHNLRRPTDYSRPPLEVLERTAAELDHACALYPRARIIDLPDLDKVGP